MASMHGLEQRLLPLEPDYRERVWGGQRLRPADPPVGEAWVGFAESRVLDGACRGRSVGELAAEAPEALLGATPLARFGARFPLLAKLLDCADWLSVQVHPNDEQAARLVGPDEFGKTEAWYFIEAAPDARILLGVKPGTDAAALEAAIRGRRILDVAAEVRVSGGDAVLIPAGMLHALGPELLLYEIQQASDTTYRVYDWDRPETAGRKLHVEESAACTAPLTASPLRRLAAPDRGERGMTRLVACPYFELDLLRIDGRDFEATTAGRSFHLLTATEGAVEVSSAGERVRLERFETLLVAGGAGDYSLRAASEGGASVARSSVPEEG